MSKQSMDHREWKARILGEVFGPLDWDGVVGLVSIQQLGPNDELKQGLNPWQRAGDVVGLFDPSLAERSSRDREEAETHWFVQAGQRQIGPFSWSKLESLAGTEQLKPSDRVRAGRSNDWVRAGTLPGLFADLTKSRSVAGQAAILARPTPRPAMNSKPAPRTMVAEVPTSAQPLAAPVTSPGTTSHVPAYQFKPTAPIITQAASAATPTSGPRALSVSAAESSRTTPIGATPRPPMATPRFTPPPRRTSGTNRSGLLDAIPLKLFGGIAAVAIVCVGLWLGSGQLGAMGQAPGTEEFWKVAQVWQQIVELQEVGGASSQWKEFQTQATPVLDELQSRLAANVDSSGDADPLIKQILTLVDTESGPTKTQGLVRRIVADGSQAKPADFAAAASVIREAAQLARGG